ncbi:MAG: four helix bundle protein [Anaerolineales bacterium]
MIRQLIRSSGGICGNIEEAYGRGIGTQDYIRILRIALGEARETQGWYFRARHCLPDELVEIRLGLIREVISLLVITISQQRKSVKLS